jgi:hypothetical protein
MNKQIQLLADEAGFMDSWFSESGDDCEQELKKFAELIVRECAAIADIERPTSLGCGYITKTKGMLIREHFGVE